MSHASLARHLKTLIVATGICGIAVYLLIAPFCLNEMFPDARQTRMIWMGALLISLLPCYGVLFYGWRIVSRIGGGNSFCKENVIALKRIAQIALADTAYVFLFQTAFLLLGLSRAGIAMFALVLVFIGIALSTLFSTLSHLIEKATILQEENDATI